MDKIVTNILESIAADLPRMEEMEKDIRDDDRLLWDKKRELSRAKDDAHALCCALKEMGRPYRDNFKAVHEFCQREIKNRERNKPMPVSEG